MSRFGTAEALAGKACVDDLLEAGRDLDPVEAPAGRHARAALRVALRQKAQLAEIIGDEARIRRIAA